MFSYCAAEINKKDPRFKNWKHLMDQRVLIARASWVFDNLANTMMMLPEDSRYNLALSLLTSDYCSQSYTASGPQVPMCTP